MSDQMKIMLSPISLPRHSAVGNITAECGHECWISQSSLDAVLDPGIDTSTACIPCVAASTPGGIRAIAKAGLITTLPGQREEVAKQVGQDETDEMFRRLNVQERGS